LDGNQLKSQNQFVDWGSTQSHMLLNPRLPDDQVRGLGLGSFPALAGHIWISSSGTTSGLRIYGLSKTAFLISAVAVNAHLDVEKNDIWLSVLPPFHVGGLAIWARAFISQSKVIDRSLDSWSAEKFHLWAKDSQATLTSLVPTQVYDLVRLGQPAPPRLRAIVVGGGALDEQLYWQARELNFALLPSYGLTECCSQVATAELSSLGKEVGNKSRGKRSDEAPTGEDNNDKYNASKVQKILPPLKLLSHVEVNVVGDQIAISSAALFTARVDWKFKQGDRSWAEVLWQAGEWYVTSDTGVVTRHGDVVSVGNVAATMPGQVYLQPTGRVDEQIKISGELISLPEARIKFSQTVANMDLSWALLTQPSTRLGAEVILAVAHSANINSQETLLNLVNLYNQQVLPPMRIRAIYFIKEIPKTALSKIKISDIKDKIKTTN